MLTIDPATGSVTNNVEYDVLALSGKTVRPGSTRVASSTDTRGIRTVAFDNPDGSASMTVYNSWDISQNVAVSEGVNTFTVIVPAGAVVHLHW